jgi:hypothetical protein
MRRVQRLIAASVLIAFCGVLAGCSSLSNFDPTDLLDFLDTKKKLPGERKAVFPEGVPGLDQGVPKDMYKGAQQDGPGTQVATAPPPPPDQSDGQQTQQGAQQTQQAQPAQSAQQPQQTFPAPLPGSFSR